MLFPRKHVDTPLPDGPPPEGADLDTAPAPGRGVMMPIRRRTRARNLAQQIAYERALNQADIDAQEAAQEAFDRRREELKTAREAEEAAQTAEQQDIPPPR